MNKTKCKIVTVPNGVIYPLLYNEKYGGDYYCEGGVVDSKGILIEESIQLRYDYYDNNKSYPWNIQPNTSSQVFLKNDYDIVYCGIISDAFGHLLIETLSRMYYYVTSSNKTIKLGFIAKNSNFEKFYEFMHLLGISKSQIEIITEPTKYNNVIVPEPSFVLNKYAKKEYLYIINEILSRIKIIKGIDKLFLSSKKLLTDNRRINEDKIEYVYNQNGYKSFYPEELSLYEQIQMIKSAKDLVVVEGTGSHMALFLNKDAKLTILKRQPEFNVTQLEIDRIKKYNVQYINCYISPLYVKSFQAPQILGFTEELSKHLIDNNFKFKLDNDVNTLSIMKYMSSILNFIKNNENINLTSQNRCNLNIKEFKQVKLNTIIKYILYKLIYLKLGLLKNKYKKYSQYIYIYIYSGKIMLVVE